MLKLKRKIFVFGSNREGRHGKGAALHAMKHYGAVYGQAKGLQGNSYGIVTKELRKGYPPVLKSEIAGGVAEFLLFAEKHPEMEFEVSPIGCGLAGFRPDQIAPLFNSRTDNINLPPEFLKALAEGEE